MTIEQIKSAYAARPFRPFDVHLADGRQIEVPRPQVMALSPTGQTVLIFQPDDAFLVVDRRQVTGLSVHRTACGRRVHGQRMDAS